MTGKDGAGTGCQVVGESLSPPRLLRNRSSLQAVAEMHAKLCMDPSGLIRKGSIAGIELFDSSIEGLVGFSDESPLRGLFTEHCLSLDSHLPFIPPNVSTSQPMSCTPEAEFYFVVGENGIDTQAWELVPGAVPRQYEGAMVPGRNDTTLSFLLQHPSAALLTVSELIALRLCK